MASTPLVRRLEGAVLLLAALGGLGFVAASGATASDDGAIGGTGRATVTLGIEHSRFSADRLVVHRGTTVRIVVDNSDPIGHELIVGPPEVHERHATGTEAAHDPVPGEVSSPPLQAVETTYTFDEVGSVTFACHLPGHVAYGMIGEFEVIE